MNFLARQPIFGAQGDVFAYELLFRAGIHNSFPEFNSDLATSSVIDTSFLIGLRKLTAGRLAFINCPRDFLLGNSASLLPPDQAVIEILETVEPDEALLAACQRLKQDRYPIALDDFVDTPAWEPLVSLADFIKVDFRLTAPAEQKALVQRYRSRGIRMLAEKIETRDEFAAAKTMGYSLFQGYFFCKPEIVRQHAIPSAKLVYLELLQASLKKEFDMDALAEKIKHEPSLTFRLLRYLNSVAFGLRAEIHSVPHALAFLGERELRKWIAVVCVAVLGEGKPDELMTIPLIRGRICESLAPLIGMARNSNDLFLLGLLSAMDAFLDQPLDLVLADLPVKLEIKDALLNHAGKYRDVLDVAIAQEQGDWEKLAVVTSRLRIDPAGMSRVYLSAVEWAAALRDGIELPPSPRASRR